MDLDGSTKHTEPGASLSYGGGSAAATASAALSQLQHPPTSTPHKSAATTNKERKRKATATPGSRGVANLTSDQLAKKRANDREAQRAIRERTRNTIGELERRIRELEDQEPYQDLRRVIAERDKCLAECEELRCRLAVVAGIVSPIPPVTNGSLNELAALTAKQSPLPPLQQAPPPQVQRQDSYGLPHDQQQQHLHPDLRSPHLNSRASPPSRAPTSGPLYHPAETAIRAQQYASPTNSVPSEFRPRLSNGDRLVLNYVFDSTQQKRESAGTPVPCDSPPLPPYGPTTPVWARMPINSPAECPLDAILGDFVATQRQKLRDGVPKHEIAGPDDPPWHLLIQRGENTHPTSALLIDILSKFPDIYRLSDRVAVFYVMFMVLRWQSCPCESCYSTLPKYSRPVASQLERAHALWYDHLPWPHMRNNLITSSVKFEDFFIPYTTTMSLNWPYLEDQVLISTPSGDPKSHATISLNPVFLTHLLDINNWSVGTPFQKAHPQLVSEEMRIEDHAR